MGGATRQGRRHPAPDRGNPRGTATPGPTLSGEPRFEGHHHQGGATPTDLGEIEPSSAEWAFSVVLVPKSDGMMPFCVDYRRLNEGTVRDVYLLPRMDDCINFLGDAKVFSTLDFYSGYWQIPVADEDRDKTTFVCHEGAYRYIRLPFGLSNAPATFQWAIDMILGGLKWKSCLVYLDDIIVFSQSAREHV